MPRTGTLNNEMPSECHYDHWGTERAIDFIDTPRDTPFCLFTNFFDPHHPFGVPQAYRDTIGVNKTPPPLGSRGELNGKPTQRQRYSETYSGGEAAGFQNCGTAEIAETRAI